MKQIVTKAALSFSLLASVVMGAANMPFPQQKKYDGCIKPSIQQTTMDRQVREAYDDYKMRFLSDYEGGYVYKSTSTNSNGGTATVSEAHGWGMVITVMMAGYDNDAKMIFDKMFDLFKRYKNTGPGSNLMAWKLYWGGSADRSSNATDGDLDIAYALLMAYKQWGDVAYYNAAKALVRDIKQYNVNSGTKHILLGNWANPGEEVYEFTRPSDWMGGHFRTFAEAFNDSEWDNIANTIYTIYEKFPTATGLISDFVKYDGNTASATESWQLSQHGEKNQTKYATNAARVPWRIASDYALSRNARAKSALDKFNNFLNNKSLTYSGIKEGYNLDGTPLNNNAGGAMYLAPFVAARITSGDQGSLTTGWNSLVSTTPYDAYQAAIKVQSMLLISGNWWHYNDETNPFIDTATFDTSGIYFDDFADADLSQSSVSNLYGKQHFPKTPWDAGGYWYTFDAGTNGSIQTANSQAIDSVPQLFNDADNTLDIKIVKTGNLEVGFPEGKEFNLSALSGLTVRAKGSGKLRVALITNDNLSLGDKDFRGGYKSDIDLSSSMKSYQIEAALLSPENYSIEHKEGQSWTTHGSKRVKALRLKSADGNDVRATIESIKFNGIEYNAFNIDTSLIKENPDTTVIDTTPLDTTGLMFDDFSNSYGDDNSQSHLGALYGYSKNGEAWTGGGYWFGYAYGGAKLTNGSNVEITDKNSGELVEKGLMNAKFDLSAGKETFGAAVECPLPDSTVEFHNLSTLEGVILKIKGEGKIRFAFNTKAAADTGWWDGYGYDITLDGTMQEIEINASSELTPSKYSQEDMNNLTWTDNGSKNVSGIKLVSTGESASFQLESIKLSGLKDSDLNFAVKPYVPVNDTDTTIIDTSVIDTTPLDTTGLMFDDFSNSYGDENNQSHLGALYGYSKNNEAWTGGGYWYGYEYGGAKLTNGSGVEITADNSGDMVKNSKMDLIFDLANGEGTFGAAVECPLPDTTIEFHDLSNLEGVVIKVKGEGKIRFAFNTKAAADTGWWDGYGYDITLDGTEQEIEISAAELKPSKYSQEDSNNLPWSTGALNVKGIKIASTGASASFQIESIKFVGLKASDLNFEAKPYDPDPVSLIKENKIKHAQLSSLTSASGIVSAQFALPQAAAVQLTVVNIQGRILAKQSSILKAGVNTIAMDLSNQGTGIYYVIAKSDSFKFTKKFILR